MDHFGIGAAIQTAIDMYGRAARGTGRTTSLLESVKTGDRVVFVHIQQAREFDEQCKECGITVECVVCNPADPTTLFERGSLPNDGRMLFDHFWVETFYRNAISSAAKEIDALQARFSGYGAKHRETKRNAIERAKWNF